MTGMKSLSLSKPLIVMMVGAPGAGKSFFAHKFATAFGAPVVSYDYLRSTLFAEPRYTNDEQLIIDRIAKYEAMELVKTKKTFVIDGGCNVKVTRLAYGQLARNHGYNTLVVWVQTDEPTCRVRATRRVRKEDGDQLSPPLTDDQFVALSKRITQPLHEAGVVISGKHTFPAQLRAVLKRLVEPRQQAANQAAHAAAQHPDAGKSHERPTQPKVPTRNIVIH